MTDIEKIKIRTSLPTAFAILIGCGSIALTLGLNLKDWQDWRKNIQERVDKLEQVRIVKH